MEGDKLELNKFLNQVDDIGNLIQDLTDASTEGTAEVVKKADSYLQKTEARSDNTGVNRSVINQQAFKDEANQPETVSQAGFMAAMEQDARERAERKRLSIVAATALKDKGNVEYREGNYEKALDYYTQALNEARDMTALYTNRAQTYIKLEQYDKAISDCDWALKVSKDCLKAYVHKGRAFQGLKQFEKALECYESAKKVQPKKETVINEYIAEVQLARQTHEEEEKARELFEARDQHAVGIVELLGRVNKEGQLPMYYSGGMRVLKETLNTAESRTLYRSHGGIHLTETHPLISRCFTASPRSLSQDELDLCSATLDTLTAACDDNEENQRQLLESTELPQQVLCFLETQIKSSKAVKKSAVKLLHQITQSRLGRSLIVAKLNATRLLDGVFNLIKVGSSSAEQAMSMLNNIALDDRFKVQLHDTLEEEVMPNFEVLLLRGTNAALLPSAISTVGNLCADKVLRGKISNRRGIWEAGFTMLESHSSKLDQESSIEIVTSTLALLANIALEPCEHLAEFATRIPALSAQYLACDNLQVQERYLVVAGRLIMRSPLAVGMFCDDNCVPALLRIIKAREPESLIKPAVRCLSLCSQHSHTAREQIVHGKALKALTDLLKNPDPIVVGNVALCLGQCTQIHKVPAALTKTDIVQDLLVVTRDGQKYDVRRNCAILLAKLAEADNRHLDKLRALNGLGILNDVMTSTS